MVVLLGSTVAGVVEIDGFSIPDSSGVFLVALAVHVLAG